MTERQVSAHDYELLRAAQAVPLLTPTDDARVIEGYALRWSSVAHGERGKTSFAANAFDEALADWRAGRKEILFLLQHDLRRPLGRLLEVRPDAEGLRFRARLSETRDGNEALTLLGDHALSGISIGFVVPPGGSVTSEGIRHVRRVDLQEISLVSQPADTRARVLSVGGAPTNAYAITEQTWVARAVARHRAEVAERERQQRAVEHAREVGRSVGWNIA